MELPSGSIIYASMVVLGADGAAGDMGHNAAAGAGVVVGNYNSSDAWVPIPSATMKDRLVYVWEIYGPKWAIFGAVVAVLSLYDLFISQVLPDERASDWPRLHDVLVVFPIWVWACGALLILWGVGIDGAYRRAEPRSLPLPNRDSLIVAITDYEAALLREYQAQFTADRPGRNNREAEVAWSEARNATDVSRLSLEKRRRIAMSHNSEVGERVAIYVDETLGLLGPETTTYTERTARHREIQEKTRKVLQWLSSN